VSHHVIWFHSRPRLIPPPLLPPLLPPLIPPLIPPLLPLTSITTAAIDSTPLLFYDIASGPPVRPYAVNPWKARYALNFTAAPYKAHWVQLPDVAAVRRAVGAPPVRKFSDGSDFYTLPILTDASTTPATIVGDLFDIACYLERRQQQQQQREEGEEKEQEQDQCIPGSLFPAQEIDYTSPHADIAQEREKLFGRMRKALTGLAELFQGPFLRGERATYADMIVGGWLKFYSTTLPEAEWSEMRGWHGGVFGKLYDALEAYAEVK